MLAEAGKIPRPGAARINKGDIGVIGFVSDRVAVMYMGRIVESDDSKALLAAPAHPFTRALMEAIPLADRGRRIRASAEVSEPPSQFHRAVGCAYAPRCPLASAVCRAERPELHRIESGNRLVACHNVQVVSRLFPFRLKIRESEKESGRS